VHRRGPAAPATSGSVGRVVGGGDDSEGRGEHRH